MIETMSTRIWSSEFNVSFDVYRLRFEVTQIDGSATRLRTASSRGAESKTISLLSRSFAKATPMLCTKVYGFPFRVAVTVLVSKFAELAVSKVALAVHLE